MRFLEALGAREIEHPGGTLYDHLLRVAQTLAAWGNDEDIQRAGMCHAAYGTDGFPRGLLELNERGRLVAEIGWRAESLVYLYASCDRRATYPALTPGQASVPWHDRFTGTGYRVPARDAAVFLEITVANELDVLPSVPGGLFRFFERCRPWLSQDAWAACISSGKTFDTLPTK